MYSTDGIWVARFLAFPAFCHVWSKTTTLTPELMGDKFSWRKKASFFDAPFLNVPYILVRKKLSLPYLQWRILAYHVITSVSHILPCICDLINFRLQTDIFRRKRSLSESHGAHQSRPMCGLRATERMHEFTFWRFPFILFLRLVFLIPSGKRNHSLGWPFYWAPRKKQRGFDVRARYMSQRLPLSWREALEKA